MRSSDIVRAVIAVVGAVLTVAAGEYLTHRLKQWDRHHHERRAAARRFSEVQTLLPDLIGQLRADVIAWPTVRVCALVPSPTTAFIWPAPHFKYCETEHDNLRGKFTVLAHHGYVEEQFGWNVPVFHLTEDFVNKLTPRRGFFKRLFRT